MASSEGGQRRKRAWRKPREAIGPGVPEATAESKPKLTRITREHGEPPAALVAERDPDASSPPPEERMDTSSSAAEDTKPARQSSTEEKEREGEREKGAQGVENKLERENGGPSTGVTGATVSVTTPLSDLVEIDGSVLEGGGQILRNAMALSCLFQRPIHITRIRAGRQNPGLRPQHLTGIQLLSELCGGRLEGDYPGSTEVTFHPCPIDGGTFTADTHTAGSVCLLLQAALPPLLFAARPSTVILKGGTNADMAPPIDYTLKVFQPIAAKFGVHFDCQLKKRGFFPKGRGEIVVSPTPMKELAPVTLTDPGDLVSLKIHAFVAGAVKPQISHQMVGAARRVLERQLPDVPIDVNEVQETPQTAYGNSSGIFILAESSTGCLYAGSANGRKNESAEKTARAAVDELVRSVKAEGCVDEHLQDQLIILMALAKGRSVVRSGPITLHTETAIHVAELMTKAKFTIEKTKDKGKEINLITCDGTGLINKTMDTKQ